MRRLPRIIFVMLAAASALICVAIAAVWVRSYRVSELYAFGYWNNRPYPRSPGIRTADALWLGSGGGKVAIRYGYDGCGGPTFHPSGPGPQGQWHTPRPLARNGRDFDLRDREPREFCGVQYAAWTNDVGLMQQAMVVPDDLLTLAFAALPALALVTRRRKFAPGHCERCGYDLRATPGQCPECGAIPRGPQTNQSLLRRPTFQPRRYLF